MSDTALRSGLIRLAFHNPDLRADLLPLLEGPTSRVKAASGKPVAWAIPKGTLTNKGVSLSILARSEAVYKKDHRPTPEGVADNLLLAEKEQGAQIVRFVENIVKASRNFKPNEENVWGFTFVSHSQFQVPYPVRVEFNEHGIYIAGTYQFLLAVKRGTNLVEQARERMDKFNKTVLDLENLFF